MKKFKFRLEKILKHKERLFNIARIEHAKALERLRNEEAVLHELRERYSQCLSELAQQMKKVFHVRSLGPYYRYMTFTKNEIAQQSKIVCAAIEEEEKKRAVLLEAAKEKESLIKLRDRQYAEYSYAVEREEQIFIDDLNSTKYARALRESV
jgi:flagellar FliJ protein